jgi:predicted  nucleic acid-binding Zn-ribbon protein
VADDEEELGLLRRAASEIRLKAEAARESVRLADWLDKVGGVHERHRHLEAKVAELQTQHAYLTDQVTKLRAELEPLSKEVAAKRDELAVAEKKWSELVARAQGKSR